jgi:hypothetical protein
MRVFRVLIVIGLTAFGLSQSVRGEGWPVPSLHPLLSSGDCDGAPDLAGDWELNILGPTPVIVQKLEDCRYRVLSLQESKEPDKFVFDIRLARLGGNLFFDGTSQLIRPDGTEVLKDSGWLPLHIFGIVRVDGGSAHFLFLDDEWLKEMIKTGKVDFLVYENCNFLTGSTAELQDFVTTFASDPKAFACDLEIKRIVHDEISKQ